MSSPAAHEKSLAPVIGEQHDELRQEIARVLEDRFAQLSARIESEVRAQLAEESALARRRGFDAFHKLLGKLEAAQSEAAWAAAVVEAAAEHAGQVALLSAGPSGPEMLATYRLDPDPASAAIHEVIASRKAVRGACAPLSDALVLPIVSSGRVAGVLVCGGPPRDAAALAIVAALAGVRRPRHPEGFETELELKAQRFARVRVSEMRLYHSQAVLAGRAEADLYARLKEEIDSAREVYVRDFRSQSSSLEDYLHRELVRTLANDDATLLGAAYPGPLA